MTGVASLAAVALAIVLAWAAVAKLRRPADTARDFDRLGLPAPQLLARAVPGAEALVAVSLVVTPGWGGVAGFVLLAAFTAWLVAIVRSGVEISCGCFGSASRTPVSSTEVVRNLGLMAMAAAAASITSLTMPDLPAMVLFTTAVLIGLVLLQLHALSQVSHGLFRAELAGELLSEEGVDRIGATGSPSP